MKAWRWIGAALSLAIVGAAQAQSLAPVPAHPSAQPTAGQAAARAERERRERVREARRLRDIAAADGKLERWTARSLAPFRDEADFNAYLIAVTERQRAEYARSNAQRVQFAQLASGGQSDVVQPICPPEDKACLVGRDRDREGETITVTGSRIAVVPLTNNQEEGVHEGDVVKQIGQYLLVLQDGRIFVIDTEAGTNRTDLRLVDRANVYRDAEDDAWYDELVVEGNRVVVTGYAREAGASELAVFRLDDGGRLSREGVFQIKSEDYYDRSNYASRLIGDELILYTPINLAEREEGQEFSWPTLRRAPINGGAATGDGQRLLRPEQLYRPLSALSAPVIHLVTRCRLGAWQAGADLGCSSQGFVGALSRLFYVAGSNAYLWSTANDVDLWANDPPTCEPGFRPTRSEDPALIHRISLAGAPMGVIGTTGIRLDQLGMDASRGRFRALIAWATARCQIGKDLPLHYFEIPDSAFSRELRPAPDAAFTPMPDIEANVVENRFTERHLIYGGRVLDTGYWRGGDDEGERGAIGGSDAVVVPIGRPQDAQRIALPHRVWRVERIGDNALLTGYADDRGLQISVIDLNAPAPRLADTLHLGGRAETEGRSHAFNSQIGADGAGLMGLPTVAQLGPDARNASRSTASDLSFFAVTASGQLSSVGELQSRAGDDRRHYFDDEASDDPAIYSCQVSCIDWYGNSRPLFTRGRVFALTGTELVEGRVTRGRIGEVQRIDLTKELPAHLRPARAAAADERVPTKH